MTTRAFAAGLIVATLLGAAQPAFAQRPGEGQLNDHVLPVAAGALVGAFATFFVLPLVVPAMAVTAAGAGTASVTASPLIALVGAGVGGYLGYELVH